RRQRQRREAAGERRRVGRREILVDPARQDTRQVRVRVREPRQDHAAARLDALERRVPCENLLGGSHRADACVVDDEGAVGIERAGVVAGDDGRAVDHQPAAHRRHSIAFGRGQTAVSYVAHRRQRHMHRIPRALALVILLIVAVYATTAAEAQAPAKPAGKGGVLRVALIGEPPTLDAHATTAVITREIVINVYEGLFALDAKYQPVPLLAERAEALDGGKRYVVHLRNNVKFHNGKTLGAADVVASLKRSRASTATRCAASPPTASPASASPTWTSCSSCPCRTTPRARPASSPASITTSSRSSRISTIASRARRASSPSSSSPTDGRPSC